MKKRAKRFVVLEEVKAVTFSRFLEWPCTGSYTRPPSEKEQFMQDGKEITKHHLTALYLGLAELYVFADSRDVGALKTRVVVDLCAAEDEAVDARFVISDIVSYVYDNTTASDSE